MERCDYRYSPPAGQCLVNAALRSKYCHRHQTADQPTPPLDAPLTPAEAAEAQRVSGLDLEEIEARANAATPGPWASVYRPYGGYDSMTDSHEVFSQSEQCEIATIDHARGGWIEEDAEFVANAREDVPALVARVRALEEALRIATGALEYIVGSDSSPPKVVADDALTQISVIDGAALRATTPDAGEGHP